MAKVFGEPGRNAAEQSFKQTKRVLLTAFWSMGPLAAIFGYALSGLFPMPKMSLLAVLSAFAGLSGLM